MKQTYLYYDFGGTDFHNDNKMGKVLGASGVLRVTGPVPPIPGVAPELIGTYRWLDSKETHHFVGLCESHFGSDTKSVHIRRDGYVDTVHITTFNPSTIREITFTEAVAYELNPDIPLTSPPLVVHNDRLTPMVLCRERYPLIIGQPGFNLPNVAREVYMVIPLDRLMKHYSPYLMKNSVLTYAQRTEFEDFCEGVKLKFEVSLSTKFVDDISNLQLTHLSSVNDDY
jgi:hypothetical protein